MNKLSYYLKTKSVFIFNISDSPRNSEEQGVANLAGATSNSNADGLLLVASEVGADGGGQLGGLEALGDLGAVLDELAEHFFNWISSQLIFIIDSAGRRQMC